MKPCTSLVPIALLLASGVAAAQGHVDLEALDEAGLEGWRVGGNMDARVDRGAAFDGMQSFRLERDSTGRGGRVTQRIPAAAIGGPRFALRARIRTEGVSDGTAGLWLRIDGADNRLYFDGLRERGARGTSDWTAYALEAPIVDGAETITIGLDLDGRGTAWFDSVSIETISLEGRPPPSAAAAHYLDYALDLIEANSIRRRAIDWPALRARTHAQARGARDAADTHLALRYVLASLGDGHSYLMSPARGRALGAAPVSNARTGRPAEPVRSARLDERVGVVVLPGFAGGTHQQQAAFAEQVQTALAALDNGAHCGFVIDLRENTGGNLWPMLAGIGPLLGDGIAGYALASDGTRTPFWYRDGRAGLGDYVQLRVIGAAYRPRLSDPPTAILIGPRTASSGEVVAGALAARPNTAAFGTPSRGLSTGNRTFPLADGAALVLTVAQTSDRHGQVYSGPLEPDVPVARTEREATLADDPSVGAARDWLIGQPGCAGPRPVSAVRSSVAGAAQRVSAQGYE